MTLNANVSSLKTSHLLGLTCLLLIASCAWSQPPAKRSVPHKSLTLRTGSEQSPSAHRVSRRQFYLSDIGLWTLEYPLSLRENTPAVPEIETGDIYAVKFQESYRGKVTTKQTHLFVAVLKRPWGYLFQRLDVEPLRHLHHSDTVSITQNLVGKDSEHWCVADQKTECPGSDSSMRTIEYELNAENRIDVPPPEKWDTAMPVIPDEIGGKDSDADSKLLIRTSASREFPYRATGGYESSCQLSGTPTNLHPVEDLQKTSHPISIEAENRFHGTDALLRCSKKQVKLGIPGLFRPPLESDLHNIRMTPFISTGPLTFDRLPAAPMRNLLRFGAKLGARDILGAFLHQQKLIETAAWAGGETKNRLLLGGMALSSAAGYPEAGLRYGYFAKQKMWNSDFNLPFRIGELYILNALGLEHATVRYQRSLDSFALPDDSDHIRDWIAWNRIRDLGFRQLPEAELPEQKDWQQNLSTSSKKVSQSAAYWQLAKSMLSDEDESDSNTLPSVNLPEQLRGFDKLQTDETKPQRLSPYGHHFAHYLESTAGQDDATALAKSLVHLPETGLPTEFDSTRVTESSLSAIDELIVLAGLVSLDTSRDQAVEALEKTLKQTVISRKICNLAPPEALFDLMKMRASTARNTSNFVAGILGKAPQLCNNPRVFLERLIQQSQAQPEPRRVLYELMELTLRSFDGPSVRHKLIDTLLEKVDFPADICRRWRLSRVFAYLESRRLDRALKQFDRLSECGDPTDQTHKRQTKVARLLLSYEKSGFLLEKQEADLQRLTKAVAGTGTCPAIAPLSNSYRNHFPVTMRPLIDRLIIGTPPEKTELELWSQSAKVDDAIETYQSFVDKLTNQKCVEAVKAFQKARQLFQKSDYRQGIEKTTFLATSLDTQKEPSEICLSGQQQADNATNALEGSSLTPTILSGDRESVSKILEGVRRSSFEKLSASEQQKLIAATIIYELETHKRRLQRFYQKMGKPFPPCKASTN